MQQAFVFEKVAVLVGPWREPMELPERGARVEVRLLADEPWRGLAFGSAAVGDRPARLPRRSLRSGRRPARQSPERALPSPIPRCRAVRPALARRDSGRSHRLARGAARRPAPAPRAVGRRRQRRACGSKRTRPRFVTPFPACWLQSSEPGRRFASDREPVGLSPPRCRGAPARWPGAPREPRSCHATLQVTARHRVAGVRASLLAFPDAFARGSRFLERRALTTRHEHSLSLPRRRVTAMPLPDAPREPRQTTRTFWASSPFRPGATSNSTRVAVLERAVAVALNRREVDEDIVPAFTLDEAEALLRVEPFHGALRCHSLFP